MKAINEGTKKQAEIIWTWEHCNKGRNLYEAYRSKVSAEKYASFNQIEQRAMRTDGYNHDLKVTGASSWFYSTMYTFTDEHGWTFIVYDTHSNTYLVPYIIGE